MKLNVRQVLYHSFSPKTHCYLIGDIGGTNANFGIFLNDQYPPVLLMALHVPSKEITDFSQTVAQLVEYVQAKYGVIIVRSCFGAAGVVDVHHTSAKPTNLNFIIDLTDLSLKTGIETMILINDFQAVGFGIQYMPPESLISILPGEPRINANKAAIGAGTGFGKCIVAYQSAHHGPLVLASEGGHADFAAHDEFDLALIEFLQQRLKTNKAISWEDILSGAGIMHLYRFLKTQHSYRRTKATLAIEKDFNPDLIFSFWQADKQCQDTFKLFSRYYGRAAKSFALDALALGGLYIAGGIAVDNPPLFTLPVFKEEFFNCRKHHVLLQQVPVIVVADYNVSLYGGAHFLLLFTGGLPKTHERRV